ncbi:2Fe-2S iron-sulfur cluster-binding protein [Mesoterricola silvestris]|uniref:Ferredoxin n=1 Tax=Mesoterricola silvestris TaxID=2927979 RepID=A0AA48GSP8_9BACT|nr:2Fe-2S iron-sulfur cluster-binding protein [Mesoterricola silvestris]BDU71041.1 ferredoxin [Mesoterricola silvestris]
MAELARVRFLPEDLLVEAPAGTPLQAIADASGADITFGCRNGSCGTCRVRILAGLEHCSPKGPEERDFLRGVEAPPDQRLACQFAVNGDVDIEYLGVDA